MLWKDSSCGCVSNLKGGGPMAAISQCVYTSLFGQTVCSRNEQRNGEDTLSFMELLLSSPVTTSPLLR